jgi:hypothetical protein
MASRKRKQKQEPLVSRAMGKQGVRKGKKPLPKKMGVARSDEL